MTQKMCIRLSMDKLYGLKTCRMDKAMGLTKALGRTDILSFNFQPLSDHCQSCGRVCEQTVDTKSADALGVEAAMATMKKTNEMQTQQSTLRYAKLM